MSDVKGARIHIRGIVQGVGFRPFVNSQAQRFGLSGWVRNTSAGVDIEVDGEAQALEDFFQALQDQAPPLARIDEIETTWQEVNGYHGFEIRHSEGAPEDFLPVSPDVAICEDCLRELLDPLDRRYRYPFINCTNCGPRFSIIQDIPYDRLKTTMSSFSMCSACASEYHNPLDRRFHAQPVACPVCGPQVWLEMPARGAKGGEYPGLSERQAGLAVTERGENAILAARELLREGKILAIKGLGGFHLACDATNPQAVGELRRRKLRVDKPFALMAASIEMAEKHVDMSPLERDLLAARQSPVVLMLKRRESEVVEQVAPGQKTLGLMLPYTPLHYLLFVNPDQAGLTFDMPPLVMTSGNLSEEPICTQNDEAHQRLSNLADAFLMHDRDIYIRCDDSVVRLFPWVRGENPVKKVPIYPVRRSRGYAPDSINLPWAVQPILATGAELKNTFCLARQNYAFLSHHIGDLENYETLQAFEQGIEHFERLFRIKPQAIAYDLHPDYLSTRYAQARAEREQLPLIGVQHHHAHIAAGMAEHGLDGEQPVIGVALDGTGYGEDGAVWGGEFLVADYLGYQRAAHLAYTPLPGGDQAVKQPWRMALSWLHTAGLPWDDDLAPVQFAQKQASLGASTIDVLQRQLESGLNAPRTSSMGRLFDAVSALIGVRQVVNYEAQAAIELEAMVNGRENAYYEMSYQDGLMDPAEALLQMIADLRAGEDRGRIAARFHGGIAQAIHRICKDIHRQTGLRQVVLSGGVWQNMFLLAQTAGLLQAEGLSVLIHRQVPTNDGGLALGQVLIAAARLQAG